MEKFKNIKAKRFADPRQPVFTLGSSRRQEPCAVACPCADGLPQTTTCRITRRPTRRSTQTYALSQRSTVWTSSQPAEVSVPSMLPLCASSVTSFHPPTTPLVGQPPCGLWQWFGAALMLHGLRSGIGHQIMVEEAYALPGTLVVASDSHSNMYGGVGCLGTPVVRTDAAAVWATG